MELNPNELQYKEELHERFFLTLADKVTEISSFYLVFYTGCKAFFSVGIKDGNYLPDGAVSKNTAVFYAACHFTPYGNKESTFLISTLTLLDDDTLLAMLPLTVSVGGNPVKPDAGAKPIHLAKYENGVFSVIRHKDFRIKPKSLRLMYDYMVSTKSNES